MSYHSKIRRLLQGSALVAGLMLAPLTGTSAWADGVALSGGDAASAGSSDGTMSAVARRAMMRGALPAGQADLDAKAAV